MKSKSQQKPAPQLLGAPVDTRPIDECGSMHEAFLALPRACGATSLSNAYRILHRAVVEEVPLVLTVSGIASLSNQTRFWINSMVKAGYIAVISTTDALVYHDGHDALKKTPKGRKVSRPVRSVDPAGDDGEFRDNRIIRVYDVGFEEAILEEQDRVSRWIFSQPEFQHKMTTTERNYRMGKIYGALEDVRGVENGLLSTCYKNAVPIFVGAPGDGSNSLGMLPLRLASERQAEKGEAEFGFEYDPLQDVMESCAYHFWGLFTNPVQDLGVVIMGGGVPKNFALQPEPGLLQFFLLDSGKYEVRGYKYDLQITSAPVSDGSLSSCPPSEAVSWGKVDRDTFQETTVSVYGDYTQLFWPLAYALFERRRHLEKEYSAIKKVADREKYLEENQEARGLLRKSGPPRLFEKRRELMEQFQRVAGSKRNLARIENSYQDSPELHRALAGLRKSGALDVGEV